MIWALLASWALGVFFMYFSKKENACVPQVRNFLKRHSSPQLLGFKREYIMCDPFVLEAANSLNLYGKTHHMKRIYLHRAVKVKLVYEY